MSVNSFFRKMQYNFERIIYADFVILRDFRKKLFDMLEFSPVFQNVPMSKIP